MTMTYREKRDRERKSRTEWGEQCQHPISRTKGMCKNPSIGEFDVPPDYKPAKRHAGQPDIARPRARLCPQHKAKVEAFAKGLKISGGSHESQCLVCQHARGKEVTELWVQWVLNATQAAIELQVGTRVFINHVEYFNLYERKARKVNTRRALVMAAERGFREGGHSATTALRALEQLRKEAGDTVETVNVQLSVSDLSAMSDAELAAYTAKLGAALEAKAREQLPAGEQQVIDVPYTVVKDATSSSGT